MGQEISLRDIYRAIFRHRWKGFGFFLAVMTAATAVTVLSPRQYRSEGKLYVRLGRENVALDPTATLGQGPIVAVPQSRESEVNTTVEVLQSRVLAEAVVDRLGPDKILAPDGNASPAKEADHTDRRELAIERIGGHLEVKPVRKSNVIAISYQAHSPEAAQAVVASLIDAYLEHHARMNRTEGAHEFLAEQAARSYEELLEAEQQLRDLKTATGLSDPLEQRRMMTERVVRLEDELAQVTRDMAASEAKIERLRKTLAELPQTEVRAVTSGVANQGTDLMRQELYTLQLRQQELLAKYTEEHPLIEHIRRQVAAAKEILSREEPTRQEVTTEPHVAYQQEQLELLREQPQLAARKVRATELRTQLAEARRQLGILNENEFRIRQLQREVDLYDSNYRTYASNLEQSRIDQALEMERISNINVAQPATYEARPVSPRVLLNLALGVLVGVFGGLLWALTAERLDHSFRTPEDIENNLELPALISVPCLTSQELLFTGRN